MMAVDDIGFEKIHHGPQFAGETVFVAVHFRLCKIAEAFAWIRHDVTHADNVKRQIITVEANKFTGVF